MKQWREAAPALEEQRRRELRALTAESALASPAALAASRRHTSGLVEQQRLLHRPDSQ